MLSCWCGLFFAPLLSHPNREEKRNTINANIKEAGEIGIWKSQCFYRLIWSISRQIWKRTMWLVTQRKLIKLSLVVTSQSAIFFQQTAMIFRQIEGSMKDFQSIRDIKNNSELLLGTTLQHAFSTSQWETASNGAARLKPPGSQAYNCNLSGPINNDDFHTQIYGQAMMWASSGEP